MLQAEMDCHHKKLTSIQEKVGLVLSNLSGDSPAQEKLPLVLETLQDQWDLLVSIIEAQTVRLSACGIDITKVVSVPTDSENQQQGGIVSSSTSTITHDGETVVTKIVTTKVKYNLLFIQVFFNKYYMNM